MSEPNDTETMVEQQGLFVQLQRAAFSGDFPTLNQVRRQLAAGGIRVEFDNNYRDKAQRQPGE